MKCKILHETAGRMRIHAEQRRMSFQQADILEAYLRQVEGVKEVKVYDRTCDAVIYYRCERSCVIAAVAAFSYEASLALAPEHSAREMTHEFQDKLFFAVFRRGITKLFFPTPLRTARSVARTIGIDEYYSEVLPEDKANYIRHEHEAGRKVIMLGDGVNDSPALSEADAGIAIRDGAAIAREVADITIGANDLYSLLTLKRVSDALMRRIHRNYRRIIGFNLMLICLGVAGILPPATSALLHNASTLVISLESMTPLLKD